MSSLLSKTRWAQVDDILDQVIDLPAEDQRAAIKNRCTDDPVLCDEIFALLAHENKAENFLNQPAINLLGIDPDKTDNITEHYTTLVKYQDQSCKQIGPYRLCEKIGEGGMGVVYRALRTRGDFHQQLAIKLLSGERSRYLAHARFEREQQLLASLVHPSIAQLYDSGLSEDGQPYYVMEYVQGTPIDVYCRTHNLSTRDRLGLLVAIAEALQFAHSHLIIHRDIKPSNILITDNQRVKLLDFGIAKLIDEESIYDLTQTGEQILTPGAAAPEQLKNRTVTVATDVYQFGLLSYELLTGIKPYQGAAESFADYIRCVCEEPAIAPSIALKNKIFQLRQKNNDSISSSRDLLRDQMRVQQELNGDIDTIVLKMLNISPVQRYSSMEALKYDIVAYLQNLPIKAKKSSLLYSIRKFLQRRWRATALVSGFIMMAISYVVEIKYQSKRAEEALFASLMEQKKSTAVSEFLKDVFIAADPYRLGAENISARDLLDQGKNYAEEALEEAPEIKAHMLKTLGEINRALGEQKSALELLEKALVINRRTLPENHPIIAENLSLIAEVYNLQGEHEKAERILIESLAMCEIICDKDASYWILRAKAINALGLVQLKLGKIDSAEQSWRSVIEMFNRRDVSVHRELANALNNMSLLHHSRGNFELSVSVMRRAISINEVVFGRQHPNIAVSLRNLAVKMIDWEELADAEALLNRAFQLQKKALANEHPQRLFTQLQLAYLFHRQGKLLEAERLLIATYNTQIEKNDGYTSSAAMTLFRLGEVQRDLNRYEESDKSFSTMMDIYRRISAKNSLFGRGIAARATLALAMEEFDKAEQLFSKALQVLPKESMRTSITKLSFAQLMLKNEDSKVALKLAREVLSFRKKMLPESHNLVSEAHTIVGLAELAVLTEQGLAFSDEKQLTLTTSYRALVNSRSRHDFFLKLLRPYVNSIQTLKSNSS